MILFDIEANGLLEEATQIWCISGYKIDVEAGTYEKQETIWGETLRQGSVEAFFSDETHVAGHNIIGYDIPMLEKFYPGCGILDKQPIDTYTLSKLAHADREVPRGCPHGVWDEVNKKTKRIGAHGLEAWGYRVSTKKPVISDWTVFTEDMLHRCEEDVDINFKMMQVVVQELEVTFKQLQELTILEK